MDACPKMLTYYYVRSALGQDIQSYYTKLGAISSQGLFVYGGIFPSIFIVDEGDNFNRKIPWLKCGAFERAQFKLFMGAGTWGTV